MPGTTLNGPQRAALLVAAMDKETARGLLRHMSDEAVDRLREAAQDMKGEPVDKQAKIAILRDYLRATRESGFLVGDAEVRFRDCVDGLGGSEPSSDAGGEHSSDDGDDEAADEQELSPVRRLAEHTNPEELAQVLEQESARCGAVVVGLLPPEKTGEVLEELPPHTRKEVVDRSLRCDDVPPELARELAEGVLSRLRQNSTRGGGTGREERISRLAFMFGSLEDEERKEAMEQLRQQEPEMAQEVQRKMFAFEDLEWVERRSLQDLLGRMEPSTLAVAIKGASRDMEDVILGNISSRMQEEVQEERELAGSVPLSKAEEAREKVMDEARRMNEEGELEFVGAQGDEYVE